MTEEQQGGTTPEPEATASTADQASDTSRRGASRRRRARHQPSRRAARRDGRRRPTMPPPTQPRPPRRGDAPAAEDAAAADAATRRRRGPPAADAPAASADGSRRAAATPPTAEAPRRRDAAADDAAASPTTVADRARRADCRALSADDTADAPAAEDEDEADGARAPRDLGPEPTTMEELLAEQDSDIKSFKHGDVVEGTVVRIDKDEILVDIGAKSEGVVSNRELYGRHAESQPQLAIGDIVLVYVLQPESQEGHAVLSLRRAGLERKWRSMQEQFEAGVIIEAPVIDHNKGGLIVDCGIRGFVPISQIVDFPRRPQNDQPRDAAQEIAEKLMPFVGRKLRLKILEVNRKANRLILSEKVALYEERREKRDELFSSLQVGQKVTGTVRSIAPFGVFIDLGGIDGLVHKSELSWNKVNNPEAGYKVGDEVEAEVIDINHERGRISLSIRRLQPDPWHSTVADFKVGDVIDGTVTKLVNFGAFVRVRDGLEGLIHISELSHQRVAHPGDVVHEGQTLKLKIISLDSERHRLGLSLKQAEEPPARPAPEPGAARRRWPARAAPRAASAARDRSAAIRCPTRSRSPRAASTTRWPRRSPRFASSSPPPRADRAARASRPSRRGGRRRAPRSTRTPSGGRRRARGGHGRDRDLGARDPAAADEPEFVDAVAEPEAVAAEPERRGARAGAPTPSPRPSPRRSRSPPPTGDRAPAEVDTTESPAEVDPTAAVSRAPRPPNWQPMPAPTRSRPRRTRPRPAPSRTRTRPAPDGRSQSRATTDDPPRRVVSIPSSIGPAIPHPRPAIRRIDCGRTPRRKPPDGRFAWPVRLACEGWGPC